MEGPELDERELVRRITARDRDALTQLYRLHGRAVYGQILLVVGDRHLSEEILQDTMVAIWRGAGSYRGDSRVRTWMIAIARRQARDRLRRRRLDQTDETTLNTHTDAAPGPERLALDRLEMAAVSASVGELRPGHREVLGLVFGAGLTVSETADVLEIPEGTVKSRLNAARLALSELLRQKGYER